MSLRSRLLAVIGLTQVLMWVALGVIGYECIRNRTEHMLDERLSAAAEMVTGIAMRWPRTPGPDGVLSTVPLLPPGDDGLACEISVMRGEIVQRHAGTPEAPGLATAPPGFDTHVFNGKAWRTYVHEEGGLRIAVADRLDSRNRFMRDIVLAAAVPFMLAVIASMIGLWWAIRRGLKPLDALCEELASHEPDRVSSLTARGTPVELQPLVQTIRKLLSRIAEAFESERRFTDDAAHELRTPLTAISAHLQVAMLALDRDPSVVRRSLESGIRETAGMTSMLDHLLLLARVEGGAAETDANASVLNSVRAVIDSLNQDARRRVVARTENESGVAAVPLPLLIAALRNLVDNALRYSPAESSIVVTAHGVADGRTMITVQDSGPGLSGEEIERARGRFWRAARDKAGHGLGLSIVTAICARYDGTLSLRNRSPSGFEAAIVFPVYRSDRTAA